MTTIAWDGHMLAADSQTSSGDSIAMFANKLIKTEDGWLTGCGKLEHVYMLKAYLDGDLKELPAGLDATCFHITHKFFHRYEEGGFAIPISKFKTTKIATGTGWVWAQAAMDFGCNAKEAVEYAKKRDIYTGGRVNCVEIIPRHMGR